MTKEAEYSFYETLKDRKIPDNIKPFFPKFYGIEKIEGNRYVVMEDLTFGFKNPSMVDIKMGTSSVGEDATQEKRTEMEKKDKGTTTVSLGIRVVGARIYDVDKKQYIVKKKDYGKNLKDSDIPSGLSFCFGDGNKIRKDLAKHYLEKLKILKSWYEKQSVFRLYSSSLLFVYEGEEKDVKKGEVRLIDFAHVFNISDGGHDEKYMVGLNNLIKYLDQLSK